MEKDPNTYAALFDLFRNLWVLLLSMTGGIVHNFQRIKKGELQKFSWKALFYDTSSSGFVGMLTYYLCVYNSLPDPLIGIACGSAGLAGVSGFNILRSIFSGNSKVQINIKHEDKQ